MQICLKPPKYNDIWNFIAISNFLLDKWNVVGSIGNQISDKSVKQKDTWQWFLSKARCVHLCWQCFGPYGQSSDSLMSTCPQNFMDSEAEEAGERRRKEEGAKQSRRQKQDVLNHSITPEGSL